MILDLGFALHCTTLPAQTTYPKISKRFSSPDIYPHVENSCTPKTATLNSELIVAHCLQEPGFLGLLPKNLSIASLDEEKGKYLLTYQLFCGKHVHTPTRAG